MDAIFCTESDELYQLYLSPVGSKNAFTSLCTNDIIGLSCLVFNSLNLHVMGLLVFHFVVLVVEFCYIGIGCTVHINSCARCVYIWSICLFVVELKWQEHFQSVTH